MARSSSDPVTTSAPAALTADDWTALRRHTPARIALGRAGAGMPTRAALEFARAHAQARDAVHRPLDLADLHHALSPLALPVLEVRSEAGDRAAYLARPDWGRRLDEPSRARLATANPAHGHADRAAPFDVAIVLADGLSALAVQSHAAPLLAQLKPLLRDLRLAPLTIATQARVALADEIGERLGARLAISLIGERPGLSAADSLGAYLTFGPRHGRSDAERNCISNIRPGGLGLEEAALEIAALVRAALGAGLSGVALRFDPAKALTPPSSRA